MFNSYLNPFPVTPSHLNFPVKVSKETSAIPVMKVNTFSIGWRICASEQQLLPYQAFLKPTLKCLLLEVCLGNKHSKELKCDF